MAAGEYGVLTREVSGTITKIVEDVMKKTMEAARAEVSVDEAQIPVHIEQTGSEELQKGGTLVNDILETAIKAAIPAVLTAIGVGLGAHPVITILLASGGGTISAQIGRKGEAPVQQTAAFNPKDVQAEVVWDQEELDKVKETAQKKTDALKALIGAHEKKCSEMIDASMDRGFGEWVQQFLLYCGSNPDDPNLRMLRSVLISRLACMKIRVYDTLVLNDEGMPDVPYQDYLMDKREGTEYTEVTVPAIYSDKAILARGEIR